MCTPISYIHIIHISSVVIAHTNNYVTFFSWFNLLLHQHFSIARSAWCFQTWNKKFLESKWITIFQLDKWLITLKHINDFVLTVMVFLFGNKSLNDTILNGKKSCSRLLLKLYLGWKLIWGRWIKLTIWDGSWLSKTSSCWLFNNFRNKYGIEIIISSRKRTNRSREVLSQSFLFQNCCNCSELLIKG